MANEKLYVKNGKVRTVNAISVVVNGIRYTNPNEEIAVSLGFNSLDALLASCGWDVYAPEEVGATLDSAIEQKVAEIENYGNSSEVKKFTVNGEPCWMDAMERVEKKDLYSIRKDKGDEFVTMWLGGKPYCVVPPTRAIEIIDSISLYAGEIENVTKSHINFVRESKSVAEAESFDVTEGYPEVPSFTLE